MCEKTAAFMSQNKFRTTRTTKERNNGRFGSGYDNRFGDFTSWVSKNVRVNYYDFLIQFRLQTNDGMTALKVGTEHCDPLELKRKKERGSVDLSWRGRSKTKNKKLKRSDEHKKSLRMFPCSIELR